MGSYSKKGKTVMIRAVVFCLKKQGYPPKFGWFSVLI